MAEIIPSTLKDGEKFMRSITIRTYQEEDVSSFYNAVEQSKDELSQWLPWCHNDYSMKDSEEWINSIVPSIWKSEKGCEFIMVLSDDQTVVGGCCLENLDLKNRNACIGYWVRTSMTNQGIATTACHFLLNYGFNKLDLKDIYIIPSIDNKASMQVPRKLPYSSMKVVHKGFKIGESISDAAVFTFTKEDYSSYQQGS